MTAVLAISLPDVALLLVACAVLGVAAGATTALLRPDSRLDMAITFGVVVAAGIAVTMLVAGVPGLLKPGPVLALLALWAAAALARARRAGVLALPSRPVLRPATLREHPWETAIVLLALLALAWQLLVALVLDPFAYDALTYHLTIVATWLREGNLDPTPLSICCARYPANAELMFAWPALFLGDDALVDTVQLGFVALGALAVAGIARSAGLGAAPSAAAGGLFALTPIVLVQAPTNFADVMVAACVLAAIHALVRYAATGAAARLVVAGLASGLVLGTKGTGIIWAAALVAAGIALVLLRRRREPVGAMPALAAFLACCLALGVYWYARNWIDTGNPVHPFAVEVAGVHVFDGPFEVDDILTVAPGPSRPWPVEIVRSWASDLTFWRQSSYNYQQRQGGLGPLWPWLGLPLLLPLAIVLARRRSPALILLGLTALVFLVQPYRWWSRFTIVLAATGALAIVAAASSAPRRWMRVAIRAAALVLALAGVVLASAEVDPASRAQPLAARDLLGLIGAPAAERGVGRLFFGEYRFLEDVPEDATVVVDLEASAVRFVYPLFGSRHSRRVLAATAGAPPAGSWVVTGAGRPLDRRLRGDGRFRPVSAERGVRVWAPR